VAPVSSTSTPEVLIRSMAITVFANSIMGISSSVYVLASNPGEIPRAVSSVEVLVLMLNLYGSYSHNRIVR
jgi:hypothetical protein